VPQKLVPQKLVPQKLVPQKLVLRLNKRVTQRA
jgi:hypothetical protein